MAGIRVTKVENLGTGGGLYRLQFADDVPSLYANLFSGLEGGGGLFMADRLRRGEHRLAGRWFVVAADGEVIEATENCTFKLGEIMRKPPTPAALEGQCRRWNDAYPVGTTVEYHPVIGEPEHRIRTTRTPAQILSGHTAVVWLEGERGCVCLDACVPVKVDKAGA
jgi:hypothetical protein